MIFPIIKNRDSFLFRDHPVLPPGTERLEYWREHKKRVVEGYWGLDGDVWRYMTPPCYFYTNLFKIEHTDETTNSRYTSFPDLRDIDWAFFYAWFICRGFSGFEDDDEYTCNRLVKRYEDSINRGTQFGRGDSVRLKRAEGVLNSKGELKKYIDPYNYLVYAHDKPLGLPYYSNEALDLFILGSRGSGKSFWTASAIDHEWLTNGAKRYTEKSIKNPSKIEIFFGSAIAEKSNKLAIKILKGLESLDGSYEDKPSPLYMHHVGNLNSNNAKSVFKQGILKKVGNREKLVGSTSTISHEIFTPINLQAGVGGRYTVMAVEEVGLLEDVLIVQGANSESMSTDQRKFGSCIYLGTGGDMDKIIQSEIVFRNGEQYNCLTWDDVYEGKGRIGFFIPSYYVTQHRDEQGNAILEISKEEEEAVRLTKKSMDTSIAYEQHIMSRPIVPSEMFLSRYGNIFPKAEITAQLEWIDKNDVFKTTAVVGKLFYDKGAKYGVKFTPDSTKKALWNINFQGEGDIAGAVILYESPPEEIPRGLYTVSYDPVRDNNITKLRQGVSLAAIYVHKAFQGFDGAYDQIVACYVGRYSDVNDIHEVAIKLAMFYNGTIAVESNLPGMKNYCMFTGNLKLLERTPHDYLASTINYGSRKEDYGYPVENVDIKIHAEQLFARWLLQKRKSDFDAEGNEIRVYRNIDFVFDKGLLQEALVYDRTNGNWDRISSILVMMLSLESKRSKKISNIREEMNPVVSWIKKSLYENEYS